MIKATAFAKVVRRVSVHPTTRAAEVERLRDVNLEVERLRRAQWEQDSAAWQAASSAITAGETTSAQGRLGGESGEFFFCRGSGAPCDARMLLLKLTNPHRPSRIRGTEAERLGCFRGHPTAT